MESEYIRAARLKWPYAAKISGDGPYALFCSELATVRLYGHWLEAATALMERCDKWDCRDTHRLFELEPVYETRRPASRNNLAALMERD